MILRSFAPAYCFRHFICLLLSDLAANGNMRSLSPQTGHLRHHRRRHRPWRSDHNDPNTAQAETGQGQETERRNHDDGTAATGLHDGT